MASALPARGNDKDQASNCLVFSFISPNISAGTADLVAEALDVGQPQLREDRDRWSKGSIIDLREGDVFERDVVGIARLVRSLILRSAKLWREWVGQC